ncbi:MAG: hypothetical protein EA368_00400 [Leptolyngbya sp. DLM2.Bin27]|nr:MAG: hypothetical protein EA368_00400 [Leptolyngbya sp. DLM2.Bin27]
MTPIKAWTTQTLTRFSRWLAQVLGFGADSAQPTAPGDTWDAEKLVNFGLEMGKGFGSGL